MPKARALLSKNNGTGSREDPPKEGGVQMWGSSVWVCFRKDEF